MTSPASRTASAAPWSPLTSAEGRGATSTSAPSRSPRSTAPGAAAQRRTRSACAGSPSSNASGFRFEAISGACPERPPGNLEAGCGAYACTLERSAFGSEWLQQHVSASYPPPSAGCSADCYSAFWASVPNTTLRGVLGVWSSHATVVHDYAAAAAAGAAPDFLLVLEDDALDGQVVLRSPAGIK